MTKRQYKKQLIRELNRLNQDIDRKIMFGRGYRQEARRHKELLQQARVLRRNEWKDRILGMFSASPYNVRKI
jgi:hypothetical protein